MWGVLRLALWIVKINISKICKDIRTPLRCLICSLFNEHAGRPVEKKERSGGGEGPGQKHECFFIEESVTINLTGLLYFSLTSLPKQWKLCDWQKDKSLFFSEWCEWFLPRKYYWKRLVELGNKLFYCYWDKTVVNLSVDRQSRHIQIGNEVRTCLQIVVLEHFLWTSFDHFLH